MAVTGTRPHREPPLVFLFSGQGSQYYGMGRRLREAHAGFAARLAELDRVASAETGCSILDVMYDRQKAEDDLPFDRLLHSHPAILMLEIALAQTLGDAGIEPDYVLGSSLGELAAAAVAGAIDPADAIRSAVHQARVAEAHCPTGAMLAVLADGAVAREPFIAETSSLVSVDDESHFVVAGSTDAIARIIAALRERGVAHYQLPVRYPFHSPLIDPAEQPYKAYLRGVSFGRPAIPMVSCARGEIIDAIDADYFWHVARRPILFRDGVAAIERLGAEAAYIDLGPSGSLAGLLTRAFDRSRRGRIHTIVSRFHPNTARLLQNVVDAYGPPRP